MNGLDITSLTRESIWAPARPAATPIALSAGKRPSIPDIEDAAAGVRRADDQILVRGAAKVTCVVLLGCLAFNLLQHATALLA